MTPDQLHYQEQIALWQQQINDPNLSEKSKRLVMKEIITHLRSLRDKAFVPASAKKKAAPSIDTKALLSTLLEKKD